MNESITIKELYSLDRTIAASVFDGCIYPWEVLSKIGDYIVELGRTLPEDEYIKKDGNVWIHKEADVFESAYIAGPAIICKGAQIRHCAFIRGKAIVGEGAVVGNSTELKNVILFDGVQVPHYNYVGDSILGYKAPIFLIPVSTFPSGPLMVVSFLSDLTLDVIEPAPICAL